MSIAKIGLDPKSRFVFAIGNVCLFTGASMSRVAREFGVHHPAAFDGLRALLLCLAVSLNYWAFHGAGRSRRPRP